MKNVKIYKKGRRGRIIRLPKRLAILITATFALSVSFAVPESADVGDYGTPEVSAPDTETPPAEPPSETPAVTEPPETAPEAETSQTENPEDVPVLGFITLPHAKHSELSGIPYENISLLGACDPEYPLYVNGTYVQTTAKGYFSFYAPLNLGDNLFRFENSGAVTEITVTRITPKPPGTVTPPTVLETPVYGMAKNTIISRFYERDDDNKPGTPLVKGTVFRIIAEDAFDTDLAMYQIHDGSYVFKNSVELLGGSSEESEEPVPEEYTISLYSVELREESAFVTLHGCEEDDSGEWELVEENYEIPYEEGRTVTGYSVEIADGTPVVSISYALTDLAKAVVLIDAGHGGTDPGAVGPPGDSDMMEKDFNLHVAEKTRDYLEAHGVTVIFPRGEDKHVPALVRMENFAGRLDMSVSVHSNSMPMQKDFWSDEGPLMFYSLEHEKEAASGLLSHITDRLLNGSDLAARNGGTPESDLRNFGLARYTGAPSMLFEMGYVCNPREYERMCDTAYLDLIGESLGEGIMRYLADTVQEEFDVPETETAQPEELPEEKMPEAQEVQTASEFAETRATAVNPFRFTLGDIVFLALVAAASLIRVVYEIKK